MKLQFKQQAFQTAAVNAVTGLFAGQERSRATFSVLDEGQLAGQGSFGPTELGVGNVLRLSDEALAENMRSVQKRNLLPMTDSAASHQFCVEMETGTGKTYVYTKTIFELNRKYGFTKFIVVVPSVAIREGVYKSFQVTEEHFALQYDSVPCRYFIYNSAKLSDVRQFAASANIEVMVINIDAFKKAENVINQAQDRLNGETAIGTYNPDWAVYLTRNGEEKLYFILETKGATNLFDLRTPEQLKIHCGQKHFEALDEVEMWPEPVADWTKFKERI